MGKLASSVINYLRTSSSEQLMKDWDDMKKYNESGPNILDVINNYGLSVNEYRLSDNTRNDRLNYIYNNFELCLAA